MAAMSACSRQRELQCWCGLEPQSSSSSLRRVTSLTDSRSLRASCEPAPGAARADVGRMLSGLELAEEAAHRMHQLASDAALSRDRRAAEALRSRTVARSPKLSLTLSLAWHRPR